MDYEFIKSLKLVDRYITSLTSARIQAIHERGEVPERFSLEHLQSLHAEIFQDLPAAFFAEEAQPFFEAVPSYYLDHNPGEFRQPSDPFNPHSKYRAYGLEDTVCTFYSCADEQDLQQAEAYLAGLDVAALKAAPYEAKVAAVAEMYQTLDFLHPFPEGNSRTLRVFTQQFASSIDLEFDWTLVDQQDLYGARDLSLLSRSAQYFDDPDTLEEVHRGLATLDKYGLKDMNAMIREGSNTQEVRKNLDAMLEFSLARYGEAPDIDAMRLLQPGREDMLYATIRNGIYQPDPEALRELKQQTEDIIYALHDKQGGAPAAPITGSTVNMDAESKTKLQAQCLAWLPEINKGLERASERALTWEKMLGKDEYRPQQYNDSGLEL